LTSKIAVQVEDLSKQRESIDILEDITFTINKGEIFALLGPDGSGKTNLIEILIGLRKKNSGSITVLESDVQNKLALREIKKRIGFLPQEFRTHDNLTVKENILFWGNMYDHMLDADELLAKFNLQDVQKTLFKKLPGNLKRKVALAITIVNDPELILLDEPTAGLDQYTKQEIWNEIDRLKEQGKTIFLSTNQALEAQALADRVAIIHKGKIRDIGTPKDLIQRFSTGNKIIIRCTEDKEREKALTAFGEIEITMSLMGEIVLSTEQITLNEVLTILEKSKINYSDIITQRPTLNDVFQNLVGEILNHHSN
jgi:ABC-2 type transport system ATP-binding protein